jgi:hypothetical protein
MNELCTKKESKLPIILVGIVLYASALTLLFLSYPKGYLGVACIFVLFSCEHIFNLVNRKNYKLAGTKLHRPIALIIPSIIVFVPWGLRNAL